MQIDEREVLGKASVIPLKVSLQQKVASCTNLGRPRRKNCTQIALLYNNNRMDLQFIKHKGWKLCSRISGGEN